MGRSNLVVTGTNVGLAASQKVVNTETVKGTAS